jgi:hypothetical protein
MFADFKDNETDKGDVVKDIFERAKHSIPKSFMLFGQRFEVNTHNEIIDKNTAIDGQMNYGLNKIEICSLNDRREWLSEDYKQMVFWHEVVHAILSAIEENELNDNEKFVTLMGNCLHQISKTMEFEQ